jgi:sulfur carrier protein
VKVSVNGVERELASGSTVADVVRALVETPERGVAVALDGEVVPRSQWQATSLGEGQAVEVLRAVQGG